MRVCVVVRAATAAAMLPFGLAGSAVITANAAPPRPSAVAVARAEGDLPGSYGGYTADGRPATLRLRRAGSRVTGTLSMDGRTWRLRGAASSDGTTVSGSARTSSGTPSTRARWDAQRNGGTLRFALQGAPVGRNAAVTLRLVRTGGADTAMIALPPRPDSVRRNSVAATGRATKTPPVSSVPPPVTSYAGWRSYTHPTGVSLRYPPDWEVREGQDGLLLLPPNAAPAGTRATNETYLLRGAVAEGISERSDPRLLTLVERLVTGLLPDLHRSDNIFLTPGDSTAPLTTNWVGEASNAGRLYSVRARAYTGVRGGTALTLLAFGDGERVAARDGVLRAVFATLRIAEPRHDARLIGEWQTASRGGEPVATAGAGPASADEQRAFRLDPTRRYRLQPDGSLWEVTPVPPPTAAPVRALVRVPPVPTTATAAAGPEGNRVPPPPVGANDPAAVAQAASAEREVPLGRWFAGEGKFSLVFDDGRALTLGYRFDGDALVVQMPDGTSQRFTRRP